MVSGQLPVGVLHIDDVPIIEREAKKTLIKLVDINDVVKVNHYLALVTSQKAAAEKKDAMVRVIAALIEAERFMRDPKNIEAVAKAAAPTGRSETDAKWSIEQYVKMEFWPHGNGLDQKKLDAVIAAQKRVGNIKGEPVKYEALVDLKLYEEALKLVK
jgi:ABC-type nitrate/sulfonate/bicarbonate transport system substrate-binding protein